MTPTNRNRRPPSIPHQIIVDFIRSGRTTSDAREHFGFASDNVANLRVHAAFKALGVDRPRFAQKRACAHCGREFVADRRNRTTCGDIRCQVAYIRAWHGRNKAKGRAALARYRRTDKGRANNRRAKAAKFDRFKTGTPSERWLYAVEECTKGLRKLAYLSKRHRWEYKVIEIQKKRKRTRIRPARSPRRFPTRKTRSFVMLAQQNWYLALRACQTLLLQSESAIKQNPWETALLGLYSAGRADHRSCHEQE